MRKFCILINPFAKQGYALKKIALIQNELKKLPLSYRLFIPENIEEAKKIAIDGISKGEYIVVAGGDGSIRALVSTIKDNHGVLGILPLGRGNDLARMLSIPENLQKACEILAKENVIKIDLANINNEPFVSICSIGFDCVATEIANRIHFLKGRIAYLYAGLVALLSSKVHHFRVTIDGKTIDHIGRSVAIANSCCYGGGMYLAPEASIQDGLFDVILIGKISKWRLLINLPKVFRGTHIHEPGFKILKGKKITVDADQKLSFCADGDVLNHLPASINIEPLSLSVLVK